MWKSIKEGFYPALIALVIVMAVVTCSLNTGMRIAAWEAYRDKHCTLIAADSASGLLDPNSETWRCEGATYRIVPGGIPKAWERAQ